MTRVSVAAACVLGLAGIATTPALASSHHDTVSHHTVSHRASSSHHGKAANPSRSRKHDVPKPTAHAEKALKGVLSIPAGGVKLFCAPGKGPLLVRKMTQGSGTTVTAICR